MKSAHHVAHWLLKQKYLVAKLPVVPKGFSRVPYRSGSRLGFRPGQRAATRPALAGVRSDVEQRSAARSCLLMSCRS